MRRAAALLASLALLLTLVPSTALAAPSETGTWIVTLRDGVDSATTAPGLARRHGGQVGYVYEHALNGFSFSGSQSAATALMRNPNVVAVEADAEVWLDATQSNPPWGLDRIDQRSGTDDSYTYNTTGEGVNVYVIDSGINYGHHEFGGRALLGHDVVGGVTPAGSDCNGHGTHVAGTIGGSEFGVAKAVNLYSVRVFGCSGGSSWSVIIAGIDWVTGHAVKPAVANMSLGGGSNSSVDAATQTMIESGVATAVAAGNGNWLGRQANACNYSPARVPAAMTVSATDSTDTKASWANYGDCVDWFAPGVGIESASHSSSTGTSTKSGTSMASPHAAGVAALYLGANPGASPSVVRNAMYDAATKGVVKNSSTANNHLLYSLVTDGGDGTEPTNSPPIANDDSATTVEDTPVTIDVLANDDDLDGDVLTVVSATAGASGTTEVNLDGTIRYTPNAGFTGNDAFSYVISDGEATSSADVFVSVSPASEPPPSGDFALTVNATKVRGEKFAELVWTGAGDAPSVNILRNGSVVPTENDGLYTESLGKGGGTYTYQVCVPDTTTCSNEVTVSY